MFHFHQLGGEQSINLALVARIEWQHTDGELTGAIAYYANGTHVRFQTIEARALAEAIKPVQMVSAAKVIEPVELKQPVQVVIDNIKQPVEAIKQPVQVKPAHKQQT